MNENPKSSLPTIMKRIFPLSTNDANNATQSAVKSFLVASGCSQVSRLKNKWKGGCSNYLFIRLFFFWQLRTLRPGQFSLEKKKQNKKTKHFSTTEQWEKNYKWSHTLLVRTFLLFPMRPPFFQECSKGDKQLEFKRGKFVPLRKWTPLFP